MVVTYVGSFPFDPETELKNFRRKQAEYEAAYRATKEPRVLHEALLNACAYLRFPPELDWLVRAIGERSMKGITDQIARRVQGRMRRVQRYRCVRDLRQKGYTWDDALNLAVAKLAATDDPAERSTIEKSYIKVKSDLEQKGPESEYFLLVAQSDPTVVPVIVSQTQSGEVTINGVVQPPRSERDPQTVEEGPIVGLTCSDLRSLG